MNICKILLLNSKYFLRYIDLKMGTWKTLEPSRVRFCIFPKFRGLYLSSGCIYGSEICCVWSLDYGQ